MYSFHQPKTTAIFAYFWYIMQISKNEMNSQWMPTQANMKRTLDREWCCCAAAAALCIWPWLVECCSLWIMFAPLIWKSFTAPTQLHKAMRQTAQHHSVFHTYDVTSTNKEDVRPWRIRLCVAKGKVPLAKCSASFLGRSYLCIFVWSRCWCSSVLSRAVMELAAIAGRNRRKSRFKLCHLLFHSPIRNNKALEMPWLTTAR